LHRNRQTEGHGYIDSACLPAQEIYTLCGPSSLHQCVTHFVTKL